MKLYKQSVPILFGNERVIQKYFFPLISISKLFNRRRNEVALNIPKLIHFRSLCQN
jgi:hypothetical protein